ncbi:MAG: ABC transporter permease subunit [Lentisphaeria bacterium]
MAAYLFRRLLLMIPTVWGILTIAFLIIQFVPGGPVDQMKSLLEGRPGAGGEAGGSAAAAMQKPRQVSEEDLQRLKKVYHLDRPLLERYCRTFLWFARQDPAEPWPRALANGANWDGLLLGRFGDSFYRNQNVLQLIREKLPVSLSLGVWSFFLSYPLCILLGIRKAVAAGSRFDAGTTLAVLVGYSIPGFVLAVLLLVLFGPGDGALAHWLPLSGLTSAGTAGYEGWSLGRKLWDYLRHLVGPLLCLNVGGFATLTLLTRNSVLEEVHKQYVVTARAKGLTPRRILYRHVLRNALIPLITDFPSSFLAMFFAGSLLIEKIFSLDGMGLLAYTSVVQRDYPVVMGNLLIMSLLGLIAQLLTDIGYVLVDPRVSFEAAE